MNEALQWASIAAVWVLLFGVLRQVGLMLPPSVRSKAHGGPEVGRRVPKRLLDEVRRVLPEKREIEGVVLAFVTASCRGCWHLLSNLRGFAESTDVTVVLIVRSASGAFREALMEVGLPTINDDRGDLWSACRITETPLLVQIDLEGRVLAKEVTHRVEALVRN